MHIVVVGAFEASSQWAHAINTVKMAQGFARLDHQVTLVCRRPSDGKVPLVDLNRTYGLTEPIRWVQLPHRLWRYPVGRHWCFALLALSVVLAVRPHLIFARNYMFPWLSSKLGIPTAAETHAHPGTRMTPFLRLMDATQHQAFRLCVTISHHLADYYNSLGVPEEKLIVLPDAVDIRLFERPDYLRPSPYQENGLNVVYAGHLYDNNGIPTVLATAALLPDIRFHFVGGWSEDITRHQERARVLGLTNVTFHGLHPQVDVPPFLWHADALDFGQRQIARVMPSYQKHFDN